MVDPRFSGLRIFVAEDEYLIATEVHEILTNAGAEVLGPVASVEDGHELLSREAQIDGAVLDVNLRGGMIFPVADALQERGVPVIFATGYDAGVLPDRFASTPRVEKPHHAQQLTDVLATVLSRRLN